MGRDPNLIVDVLGRRPRFVCATCNDEVPKACVWNDHNTTMSRQLHVELWCHPLELGRPKRHTVKIPMVYFTEAPVVNEDWRFIVGFEGEWSCHLRRIPKEPFFYSDPPLGVFTQEQLADLFGRRPMPPEVQAWGFRSEYYTIRHDPTNVSFPAEFWFKS